MSDHNIHVDLAVIKSEIANIGKVISELVTRHEFLPVKMLAYGLAASVFTGIGAIIVSRILGK